MKILSLYRHIIPLEWNSSGEVHRRQKVLLFFPVIMWGHVFQVPAPQLLEVNHRWTSSSSSFYFFSTSQKIGKNVWNSIRRLHFPCIQMVNLFLRPIVSFLRSQQYQKEVYVKNCKWTSNRVFFRLCGGSWWRSGNDGNCHTLLLGTLGRWVVAAFNWRKNAYYIVLLFYM